MPYFPTFMKSPANIASSSQFTDDIEGYVFDGADGSQVVVWTAHADRVSKEHVHDFDESASGRRKPDARLRAPRRSGRCGGRHRAHGAESRQRTLASARLDLKARRVAGDPRLYGRVYIGSGGRGILYGDPP